MLVNLFVVLCLLTPIAWASFAMEIVPIDKDKPDICVIKREGIEIKVGEKATSKTECAEFHCSKNGDSNMLVEVHGCGTVSVAEGSGCTVETNKTQPYPDCCPKLKCDKKDAKKKD